MAKNLKPKTPGEPVADNIDDARLGEGAGSELEVMAADNARLTAEVATLTSANASLKEALDEALALRAEAGPAADPPRAQAVLQRQFGDDWANMTSTQAKAAGCRTRVLCSDGWYVPE